MDEDDLQALLPALDGFHARFGRFFVRTEGRAFGRGYLIGLASPIERKNAEDIAERVGPPRASSRSSCPTRPGTTRAASASCSAS